MSTTTNDAAHPLVRKLESIFSLTAEEQEALRTLPMTLRDVSRNDDVLREGDRPSFCTLLLDGLLFRCKVTTDGKRQILAFHIPGEIPDLQSLYLKTLDHSMAALTHVRLGSIEHRDMFELMARCPRIAGAFWRETLIDAAIFREWVVNLGVRPAPQRLAHFFCEIYARLVSIGVANGRAIPLPTTQEQLADVLGISAVHTNRALQNLRSLGFLEFEAGWLKIRDWNGLAEFGEFDPTYLHLRHDPQL